MAPTQTLPATIREALMAENRADRKVMAHVTGKVQGVWFRAWTKGEAERRGLRGWVRNEPDGSVTAFIAGPAPTVNEMLTLLWQGPPAAQVSLVSVEEAEDEPDPSGFTVTR